MTLSEYMESIKNKRVCVIGIGVSNIPLIRLLCAEGIDTTVCDKRTEAPVFQELRTLGAKLCLGEAYLDDIDADIIFRTPGIRPDLPQIKKAVERGALLTSEMEAFFKVCPCRICAVTGSDGKTTTTTLISELLKAQGMKVHIGGNIGHPLLCDADKMAKDDVAVVELSSFQLMTMHGAADTAVVTNVAPNHLDVHKDMQEYIDAKANVFAGQTKENITVLNLDNDITVGFAEKTSGTVRFFSMKTEVENGVFCREDVLYKAENGAITKLMDASDIKIPGRHNIENYMAAYCAVMDTVTPETLVSVARTFGGVAHRIELVREKGGVKYFNDSIASSPSRTTAGLRSFDRKVILIAGGKDKGVPFDTLGGEIIEHVKKLVVTGLTKEKIRDAVIHHPAYRGEPAVFVVEDFKEAVLKASELAGAGDVVLLSPACTSFDKFKNFEERGNVFKAIVNEL